MGDDTEAIVRRAATKLLEGRMGGNPPIGLDEQEVNSILRLAAKDLDWEVRENGLKCWEVSLDRVSESTHGSLESFVQSLKSIGISEELLVKPQDWDDKRRLHKLYLLHQKIRTQLVQKYGFDGKHFHSNNQTIEQRKVGCSLGPRPRCGPDQESLAKRPKLDNESMAKEGLCEWKSCLVNPGNDLAGCESSDLCPTAYLIWCALSPDLEDKLMEFDEFCEIQHGLLTVIEDIMQSQSDSNQIDLIDCF